MRNLFAIIFGLFLLVAMLLGWQYTAKQLRSPPESLALAELSTAKIQVLDRYSRPLNTSYQNRWNAHDYLPLHEIPELLQQIFVLSEDKRFYQHQGVDWLARFHASWQNLKSLQIVRGASTITEQVVRIVYPRPRTFWSRWLEGFEANLYEQRFSKAEILEFYLNQVPYAANRRGVAQAARYYFDRDVHTLDLKEMMALSVLVRSPSRLDLRRGFSEIQRPIKDLAIRLLDLGIISSEQYHYILNQPLELKRWQLPVEARHFVRFVQQEYFNANPHPVRYAKLQTTLDGELQNKIHAILQQRLIDLRPQLSSHGAVLVVDHHNQEILAWVNAEANATFSHYDAVIVPRQPGSALKPFLYALALEQGWNAATLIADAPLLTQIGSGLHAYRNYSRQYYGLLPLRDALGNSLNTPAVRTIQFVGVERFLQRLRELGINSLSAKAEFYGEGLALGNGELSLFELVQAYTVLANQGQFKPLKFLTNNSNNYNNYNNGKQIFPAAITSIIADILADPDARRLEFGRGTLLRFPIETAIKTGTSTDYRDAWAIGFNYRYTVGVWLGNLDQLPMEQISGTSGAALVLRTVFAELNRHRETQPLFMAEDLVKIEVCRDNGKPKLATDNCISRMEKFLPDNLPNDKPVKLANPKFQLKQPTQNLQLALDPRIPAHLEQFKFELTPYAEHEMQYIEWLVNNEIVAITQDWHYFWSPSRGQHSVQARLRLNQATLETPIVNLEVR
jgi:penicillin-binding protein 1C